MDLPVFNLKPLKQYFYYFLTGCILMAIVTFVLTIFTRDSETRHLLRRVISWYYVIPIFILTYLIDRKNKKDLAGIAEMEDYTEKFKRYEILYKNKLIWNATSIALSGFLLIVSQNKIFLYTLIFQLVMMPVFYPKKSFISNDLKNKDIVFI